MDESSLSVKFLKAIDMPSSLYPVLVLRFQRILRDIFKQAAPCDENQ